MSALDPPSWLIYGTAWKEEETRRLTKKALVAGFRAIDTANQRKHYVEDAVGAAIAESIDQQICRREDLFIQTKFTFQAGQDHRLPYDPNASLTQQVHQSFESSRNHLRLDTIDAYVLHGPSRRRGLGEADWEVWRAMEALHGDQRCRHLGISNVSPAQLEELIADAHIKPQYVQNRCFARTGWDHQTRQICQREGITYQGFSLLTANTRELNSEPIRQLAAQKEVTVPQLVFRFAADIGIWPLTGTTDVDHMEQDLAARSLSLSDQDLQTLLTPHRSNSPSSY